MFLFPWLYRGQRISDFEKIDIFGVTPYFSACAEGPLEGQKSFFTWTTLASRPEKF